MELMEKGLQQCSHEMKTPISGTHGAGGATIAYELRE